MMTLPLGSCHKTASGCVSATLFANANRADNIATARALLDSVPPADPQEQPDITPDAHMCCLARAHAAAPA